MALTSNWNMNMENDFYKPYGGLNTAQDEAKFWESQGNPSIPVGGASGGQTTPTNLTTMNNITPQNPYDFTKTPTQNVVDSNTKALGLPEATTPVDNTAGMAPKVEQPAYVQPQPQQQQNNYDNQVFDPVTEINRQYAQRYKELRDQLGVYQNQMEDYRKESMKSQDQISGLINSIKDYQGSFRNDISSLIQSTLQPFNYNANEDTMLQQAINTANKGMMEEMNRRGVLNSSQTADRSAMIRSELIPKFQQIALQNYNEQIDKKLRTAEFLNRIDQQDFERYSNYAEMAIKQADKVDERTIKSFENVIDTITKQLATNETARKNQVEEQLKMYDKALSKLEKVGYVTNDIASILGLPVGTPSYEVTKDIEQKMFELEKINIQSKNRLEEIKLQGTNAIDKMREETKIKAEENAVKDRQTAMTGEYIRQLSQVSPDEALQWLSNPENAQQVYSEIGGENYQNLIETIKKDKQTDFSNQMRIKSDERANAASERAAAASERSASAAERRASNEVQKDINERVKDYSAVIADEMYDKTNGLDYTKLADYMEKLIARGESKDVIDLLSRKWNFDENSYNDTKTNANLAGLLGY